MSQLTSDDWAVVQVLKGLRIIEPIDTSKLESGVLLVCGDGIRCPEGLFWMREQIRAQGKKPCLHLVTRNGGPLMLVHPWCEEPKLSIIREDAVDQIREGLQLMGLDVIISKGHGPCGKAGDWKLPFLATLTLYADAARYLERQFIGVKVTTPLHLDGKNGKMRTYRFHRDRFTDWALTP